MNTERKEDPNDPEYLKNVASFHFFFKLFMQGMPQGKEFKLMYDKIEKENKKDVQTPLFVFDPNVKDVKYWGFDRDHPVEAERLPAVGFRSPLKLTELNFLLRPLVKLDDLYYVPSHQVERTPENGLVLEKATGWVKRQKGEMGNRFAGNFIYYRIPTITILKKIPDLSAHFFYDPSHQSTGDRHEPERAKELIEVFNSQSRLFPQGLIKLISAYEFDPSSLVEAFLDNIMKQQIEQGIKIFSHVEGDSRKLGLANITLEHCLGVQIILHPEITNIAEDTSEPEPPKSGPSA